MSIIWGGGAIGEAAVVDYVQMQICVKRIENNC